MNEAKNGAMAAIIGLNYSETKSILTKNQLENVTISNHNTYKQFVISGNCEDIELAKKLFQLVPNASFIPLKVSGAFHSPYMSQAKNTFNNFLSTFHFSIPNIPILANINAKIYHPSKIKEYLANQIAQPVMWTQIIEKLLNYKNIQFISIGHGNIINGLIQKIQHGQ